MFPGPAFPADPLEEPSTLFMAGLRFRLPVTLALSEMHPSALVTGHSGESPA